jgi:acetyl esterase/lipase
MSNLDTAEGLKVPARTIPVPRTVSPEAQAFLGRGLPIMPPDIDHRDKERWREHVKGIEPIAGMRARAFPAEFAEHPLSNCRLYEVVPASLKPGHEDKALLHIHGGAFIAGGGRASAYSAQTYASLMSVRSFSVDYRMPPDFPYPAGLDDALEAYRFLLERYDPSKIAFEGSSAGANLVAALILRARDEGLPLPGACALHTAGGDLTAAGDTFETNQVIDVVLRAPLPETMLLYAGGHDLSHPYLSPVFGVLRRASRQAFSFQARAICCCRRP